MADNTFDAAEFAKSKFGDSGNISSTPSSGSFNAEEFASSKFNQSDQSPTIAGEFGKGLEAGVQQIKGMGYGLGALAGEATGIEPLKDWSAEGIKQVEEATPKAAVGSFTDIESAGDLAKYLSYGVASNLPNMLLSLTGGGAGALAAKFAVRGAAKKIIEETAKKALITSALNKGAMAGAGLSSFGMEAGSIASDQLTETGQVDPGRAVAAAIPAAILDVIPEWYLVKRLKLFAGGNAIPVDEKRALFAVKVAGRQFLMEAPTEAMQSALERSAVPGKSLTNKEAWDEYINSFILGGATGGIVGGGASVFAGRQKQVLDNINNSQIQQDIRQQEEELDPVTKEAIRSPLTAANNDLVDKLIQPTADELYAQSQPTGGMGVPGFGIGGILQFEPSQEYADYTEGKRLYDELHAPYMQSNQAVEAAVQPTVTQDETTPVTQKQEQLPNVAVEPPVAPTKPPITFKEFVISKGYKWEAVAAKSKKNASMIEKLRNEYKDLMKGGDQNGQMQTEIVSAAQTETPTLEEYLISQGFPPEEIPYGEIDPKWEDFPIIKAMRKYEKLTGKKLSPIIRPQQAENASPLAAVETSPAAGVDVATAPAEGLQVDYQKEAEAAGVTFNGMQERVGGKPPIPTFTDKQTGATFYPNEGETVQQAADRKRAEFALQAPAHQQMIQQSIQKPTPVSTEVATKTKVQTKATLQSKLDTGDIAENSPVRLTTVDELRSIIKNGRLPVGSDFEGHPSVSAQRINKETPIVAYGANNKISAAIIFPEGSVIGKGEQINEVLMNPDVDISQLKFVVDGDERMMTLEDVGKLYAGEKGKEQYAAKESRPQPTFYSQMQRVLEQKLPGSSSAENMHKTIESWVAKGEFKKDEYDWSGLGEWLKSQYGKKLSKQDVVDYVAANQVEIKEVTKKQYPDIEMPSSLDGEMRKTTDIRDTTKFSQYQLHGGDNYRELLLTLPAKESKQYFIAYKDGPTIGSGYSSEEEARSEMISEFSGRTDIEVRVGVGDRSTTTKNSDNYRSSHWDEPNVLAHVRMNDRTDTEGNRVLFLEEVQSDWHQEGRKKGYAKSNPTDTDIIEAYNLQNPDETKIAEYRRHYIAQGVPSAPFAKTWPELVMKRMLRYAAENGYDKLAWTTGEQQAERYDLSKHVERIRYNIDTGSLVISRKGMNKDEVIAENLSPEKLDDYIGKDIAKKLMEQPAEARGTKGYRWKILSGLDLKVGGEGMKGFYDTILPAFMNKYAKKWGAKVEEDKIITDAREVLYSVLRGREGGDSGENLGVRSTREEAEQIVKDYRGNARIIEDRFDVETESVHSIPITPAMQESVMAGQPMFTPSQTSSQPTQATTNVPVTERQLTPATIQSMWPGAKVVDNGTFQTITTSAGVRVIVSSVANITPNEIAFKAGRSDALKSTQFIAGEFRKLSDSLATIKITKDANTGDWTFAHESGHALQEMVLNKTDQSLLRDYVRSQVAKGVLKPNDVNNFGNKEDISDFIADVLTGNTAKYQPSTTMQRIIAKIKQFADRIAKAFGIRTVNQVVEDIKSGQVLHGRGVNQTLPDDSYMVAAWHGSPHTFDKFSTEKIGTGEGAQAYGYGLYFAGKKAVAEWYKRNLSHGVAEQPVSIKWVSYADDTSESQQYEFTLYGKNGKELGSWYKSDSDELEKIIGQENANDIYKSEEEGIFNGVMENPAEVPTAEGRLYEVELAPQEDEYLLWDKPLSEQSEKVKKALERFVGKTFSSPEDQVALFLSEDYAKAFPGSYDVISAKRALEEGTAAEWIKSQRPNSSFRNLFGGRGKLEDLNGAAVYAKAAKENGDQKAASDYLHSLGIRGIKYLDGTSRGKGEGNYNYVIFSDADVSIKEMYNVRNRPSLPSYSLSDTIKSSIGSHVSTFLDRPENIQSAEQAKMVDFLKGRNEFSKLDYFLSVPFRFSQKKWKNPVTGNWELKYPEWNKMWKIHGIDRPEIRSLLRSEFIKEAEPLFNMNKLFKAKGYTKEQTADSLKRIERVAFAGDALGFEYTADQLAKGIVDEYGDTVKLNADEYEVYSSIRRSLDKVLQFMLDNQAEQSLRTYRKQKWYGILASAMGIDLDAQTIQNIVRNKGLNGAALARAKKIQVDIKNVFDRMDKEIDSVSPGERVKVADMYEKLSTKMQADLTKFRDYVSEVTGVKDKAKLNEVTKEVFAAYMQSRPQMKIVKDLRNQLGQRMGYIPRMREQGKYKMRLMFNEVDADGDIIVDESGVMPEPKELFSKMYSGKIDGGKVLEEIMSKYGKDGKLAEGYYIDHVPVSASPESAFEGVGDVNLQKLFDDAIQNMQNRGIVGMTETYRDAQGNEINLFETIRQAGFESLANQLKSRGAMRHAIRRSDDLIKGYNESGLPNILLNYISSMAGLMTKQSAAADALELISTVKNNPSLFDSLARYNREMLRNDSTADKISGWTRGLAFGYFLGGVLKAPIINITQNPIVGFAELAKYRREHGMKGIGSADAAYMKSMADVLRSNTDDITKADSLSVPEKEFIQELISSGIATDQYIRSVFDNVTENAYMKTLLPIMKFIAKPFSMSEVYNRKSAAIAIYRTAYDMHLKNILGEGKLKGDEAAQEARRKTFDDARTFIDNVHYAYGKTNRPLPIMSGDVLGATASSLYTFKGFVHNFLARQAELISERDFKTLGHTLAYLALFGGVSGLPFIKDGLEFIEKQFGYSPMTSLRKNLRNIGGETLEKFGATGLPSVLGINMSGSIATGLPWPIGANSPEDSIFGVWGGMLTKGKRVAESLARGDLNRALTEGSPEFIRAPRIAARESEIGRDLFGTPGIATNPRGRALLDESGKPLSMSTKDAIMKSMGFNPADYARDKEKNQVIVRQVEWVNEAKKDVAEKYRIDKINNSPDALKDMMNGVRSVNEKIRERGLQKLVPLMTVSNVIERSKMKKGKREMREAGYKRDEL